MSNSITQNARGYVAWYTNSDVTYTFSEVNDESAIARAKAFETINSQLEKVTVFASNQVIWEVK